MANCTPSGERMLRCLGIPGLTYRERVVLAALAYHDGPGGAYPSLQTLADECGMSRSRASEAVGALCAKGRLIRQRWRTTNRYLLVLDCPENPDSQEKASLSAFPEPDCPEIPDTNRKEPEDQSKSMFLSQRERPATRAQIDLLRARAEASGRLLEREPATFREADEAIRSLPELGSRKTDTYPDRLMRIANEPEGALCRRGVHCHKCMSLGLRPCYERHGEQDDDR